ncbi:hypothetical protein GCM10023321_18010 [Pseudonocardia eucalypti]|uniref:Small integral membrane protein n=1 Tax=Pseudonocardia eucalypti TaxID=648755 RepID=A0ABP9PYR2_9PSEU|nr:putative small integral membrane protein [Pseudonocardia eucalypti]
MDPVLVLLWLKVLLVAGLATYLSLFVLNNLTDPGTNSAAVERMMSMRELRDDPPLGRGVLWRAVTAPAVHRAAFALVVVVQAIGAGVLWLAAALLAMAAFQGYPVAGAIGVANLGLAVLVALCLGFLLTGLWFSYWVKMGPVQQGHTTLLLIGLVSVLTVNI